MTRGRNQIHVLKVNLASSKRSCETIATSTKVVAKALNFNRFLIPWTSPWRISSAALPSPSGTMPSILGASTGQGPTCSWLW